VSFKLRGVGVDSAGIGFSFAKHIRSAGYLTVGINVASAAKEKEQFANAKAARYWALRARFLAGAAKTWRITKTGRPRRPDAQSRRTAW
jgi:hypothetical protein